MLDEVVRLSLRLVLSVKTGWVTAFYYEPSEVFVFVLLAFDCSNILP